MQKRIPLKAIVLAAGLCAGAALSNAQSAAMIKPQSAPSGVVYVTGGVGDAQQKTMKEAMQDYNLRLTFSRPNGNYLANVKVQVDKQGKSPGGDHVLDVTSTGPMLFARVPDGDYQVKANADGEMQTKMVSIKQGEAKELIYRFPEN